MSVSVELDEQTATLVQELATTEKRSASEVIHAALSIYAGIRERPLPKVLASIVAAEPTRPPTSTRSWPTQSRRDDRPDLRHQWCLRALRH